MFFSVGYNRQAPLPPPSCNTHETFRLVSGVPTRSFSSSSSLQQATGAERGIVRRDSRSVHSFPPYPTTATTTTIFNRRV
jgi:hypothetical protein